MYYKSKSTMVMMVRLVNCGCLKDEGIDVEVDEAVNDILAEVISSLPW